jgi:molybdopterin-containing oxidoreductase family iron-sulfur binding subunit
VIGLPNYYATSLFDGREGLAVTVKTREGRPLFIAGSKDHPGNGMGVSVRGSSQLLNLYDPDRVRTPIINSQFRQGDDVRRGKKISVPRDWDSIDQKIVEQMEKGDVAILTGEMPSPSMKNLLTKFRQNTGAQVYTWTAVNQTEVREAAKLSFGIEAVPKYRYDKAKTIVSIDGDFIGTYLNTMESSRLFDQGRNPESEMSRLVSFQSVPSLTSLNADDNHPIKASQQLPLVLGMIHELAFVLNRVNAGPATLRLTEPYKDIYKSLGMSHDDFAAIVRQLADHMGEGIVIAGGLPSKTEDAVALQIAVNHLNDLLGNNGATIHWSHGVAASEGSDGSLLELIKAMQDGQVKTLIINELNPVYSLPESMGFAEALKNVEMIVATNNWMDETAVMADYVTPAGHQMENWGDYEFEPGLVNIQQPTIQPLHNTRSFGDSLMKWSEGLSRPVASEDSYFDYLKSRWMSRLGSEQAWYDFLQKGYEGSTFDGMERGLGFNPSALNSITVKNQGSDLELSLYTKVGLHDGTMANVSWLQELPDPVSKIVWDNYLIISPVLADTMKLRDGSMVRVETENHTQDLPVYIAPGQNPGAVAVAIGYGRSQGGEVQKNVGFDVQDFAVAQEGLIQYAGIPVKLTKLDKLYDLAQTQGHHSMHGRQLAVESTAKHYQKSGDLGLHKHKIFSIWGKHEYNGHKWGLVADLNSCTGCGSCIIACQSENNIPVVGKKYVLGGREMHWIRIDRYYSGDEKKSVDAIFQPVMCQHCENAPCETVCPVLATVHSDEGLNDMVYNRCVGTRYCSNNCPYKVRRFNWFYYDGHHRKEPLHMALNPDVTVRTRGVMEKCTFCVQRIKEGKNIAKDEKRPLKDGDIKTACQEVCPSNALVFGDLNDKDSRVSQLYASQRNYALLEEFNTAPRVRYLAKIRNTDRDLGGGHHHGGGHGNGQGAGHSDVDSADYNKEGH